MLGSAEYKMQTQKSLETLLKFERNHVVSAGAGSGKTGALVELYINLIESRISAKDIVVITFTEKAAGELKQRIEEKIQEKARESSSKSSVLSLQSSARNIWSKAMRDISSAPIGTFHTICARMLREHAVEAGIAPVFKIIDEYESLQILKGVVKKGIIESINKRKDNAVYWVKSIGFYSAIKSLLSVYQNLRNHGYEVKDAEKLIKDKESLKQGFSENLKLLIDGIEGVKGFAGSEIKGEKTRKSFEAFIDACQGLREKIGSLKIDSKDEVKGFADYAASILPDMRWLPPSLKIQLGIVSDAIENINRISLSYETIPHIHYFLNIIKSIDLDYSRAKENISSLDFQDILNMTKDMLIKNKDVRRFYKGIYKKVLVDEFQDTNKVQALIVYSLAERDDVLEDVPSIKTLADSKLAIVGDMKQSIYGFRGADIAVFEDIIKGFDDRNILYLNNNHRSCRGIVSFVNSVFIKGKSDFIFNENALQVHTRDKDDDFGDDKRVELILFQEDKTAEENRVREADVLAKRIRRIVGSLDVLERQKPPVRRKAGFGDIAILFRTLNDVKIYEDALKRQDVQYYLVKGGGFYHCQEVLDIYNMLRHIEMGCSDIYLAGVLRSPFAGLMDETLYRLCRTDAGSRELSKGFYKETDFKGYPEDEVNKIKLARKWFNKWKTIKDRLTIAELIETILADTDYLAVIISTFQGEQKAANVKKLIETARRFETEGNATIRDFIYYLKSIFEDMPKEPEAQIIIEGMDAVKLMTVHQAKGLEFPIVVIPDIGRKTSANSNKIIFSPKAGIAVKYIDADGNTNETSILKEAMADIKQRESDESRRVFYVACTRARDYLILSGEDSKKGENWRAWLNNIFNDEIDGFIKSEEISSCSADYPIRFLRGEMISGADTVLSGVSPLIDTFRGRLQPSAKKPKKSPRDVVKDVFDFIPPPPSELVVSATALADFMMSPDRFDITKTIEDADLEKAKDIGSLVHRVMEKLDYKQGQGLKELIRDISKDWIVTDDEVKNISADIERYIENSIFKEVSEAKEVYREFPFFMPVNKDGFTLYVKGIIDLLYCDKNGNWKIIDYKYSEYTPDPFFKDENIIKYKNQIKIYASAVSQGFGCNIESAILFMKNGINILKQEIFDIESFKLDMLEMGKKFAGKSM